jgi:anti-anti-sigma factor
MKADERPSVRPHGELPTRGRIAVEHHAPGLAIVVMRGEHDISTRPAVAAALARASRHSDVIVDLSECSLIDSTVIGLLITSAKALQARGEQLVLAVPPEPTLAARVVAMTRLAEVFPVYASRADAIAGLADAS